MRQGRLEDFRHAAPGARTPGRRLDMVGTILRDVRAHGDSAVRKYTLHFDGAQVTDLRVSAGEMAAAAGRIPPGLLADMRQTAALLRAFAAEQKAGLVSFEREIEPGVFAGQRVIPIDRVGIYVPGGRHPLFSSLLMAAVPAREAGCREVVACSPPRPDGAIPDEILAAAAVAEVDAVFLTGGVQAIAAMAYGTGSIARVDKIVGPGNAYVTEAKRQVSGAVGLDFVAGPSEVLIMADDSVDADLVAADLVAQAEHDPDARAILLTDDSGLLERVRRAVDALVADRVGGAAARESLDANGFLLLVPDWDAACAFADRMAPEHLELCLRNAGDVLPRLRNYGACFLGSLSGEVLGDYCAGINHVLPTSGAARWTGGLGVRDFLKLPTTLRVIPEGLRRIGPPAARMARAEGLEAHAAAASRRLTRLDPPAPREPGDAGQVEDE